MRMFKHSSGMIVAFGFNMQQRVENSRVISWSDPDGKSWESLANNLAGWNEFPWPVDPEFVFEVNGDIVGYQPGCCIRMQYIGAPAVWHFTSMYPDGSQRMAA